MVRCGLWQVCHVQLTKPLRESAPRTHFERVGCVRGVGVEIDEQRDAAVRQAVTAAGGTWPSSRSALPAVGNNTCFMGNWFRDVGGLAQEGCE